MNFGESVNDQVRAQVRAQVLGQVRAQVLGQVRDQVRNQVRFQVRNQVWEELNELRFSQESGFGSRVKMKPKEV